MLGIVSWREYCSKRRKRFVFLLLFREWSLGDQNDRGERPFPKIPALVRGTITP
jgi:hypothetical protein